MSLVPTPKDCSRGVRRAIQKLASSKLGPNSSPIFLGVTASSALITNLTCTSIAADGATITALACNTITAAYASISALLVTTATIDEATITNLVVNSAIIDEAAVSILACNTITVDEVTISAAAINTATIFQAHISALVCNTVTIEEAIISSLVGTNLSYDFGTLSVLGGDVFNYTTGIICHATVSTLAAKSITADSIGIVSAVISSINANTVTILDATIGSLIVNSAVVDEATISALAVTTATINSETVSSILIATKLGIGTTTIPHAGRGIGKVAIDGPNANGAGPHVQFTTDTDDYPVMGFIVWSHDNMGILFDHYWDAGVSAWKSSDAGSNFQLYKSADKLWVKAKAGVAVGETITGWLDNFAMLSNGKVGFGTTTPGEQVDVEGNTNVSGVYKVEGTQVVKEQQAHIADAPGDTAANNATTINAILAMLEAHGLIADS